MCKNKEIIMQDFPTKSRIGKMCTNFKGYLCMEKSEKSQSVLVKIKTGDNKVTTLLDLTAD